MLARANRRSLNVVGAHQHAAYVLLRASGRLFLEAAPERVDPDATGRAMTGTAGTVEVHDPHVWEVTSGFPSLPAHVAAGREPDCHAARAQVEAMPRARSAIDHTTLRVHEGGRPLAIESAV